MSIAKKKSLFFLPHNHCAKESLISCVCVCVTSPTRGVTQPIN